MERNLVREADLATEPEPPVIGGSADTGARPLPSIGPIAFLKNRRLVALAALAIPSGLPLGLILITVPVWMSDLGIKISTVGWFSLVQLPWNLKFLWAPILDRFGLGWPGRRRSWILISQVAVMLGTACLAFIDPRASTARLVLVALVVTFWSATQDIAFDSYAVNIMEPDEQGIGNGARVATYRLAMYVSGAVAISTAEALPWHSVFLGLAALFLPAIAVTLWAPEPAEPSSPPASLHEAVTGPLLEFFRRSRAIEIACFVVLFKAADNLAGALVSPFLLHVGFAKIQIGLAQKTIGLVCTILGSVVGGALTSAWGLTPALWVFGIAQSVSTLGYAVVAHVGPNLPLMYGAVALETLTAGMGTAAFLALLTRLTAKRFSATQYALLSSLMGMSRTLTGPLAGIGAEQLGWTWFFALTPLAAVPGMVLLWRFAPWSGAELTTQS
ncbi:MAG TPA: MFS transporter [Candidatus Nitrosopolaris sp.]|nr:MFS transporter [Candidatus Nitrosopolaris sp.]